MNCVNCGKPVAADREICGECGAPGPKTALRPLGVEESTFVAVHANDVLGNKWRVERKLGEGGMGTVYLAHDLDLDRKVAIKILASALSGDAGLVTRFEREARMTASLEHPNIVPVYAVGRLENRPFIVMKKLEGRTLAVYLREKGALAAEEILALMRQLCAGLDFIHARGFIHRDIKSGNIFIGPDGHATILDFGVLRTSRTAEALTYTGMVIGTPQYMSPEQALGVKAIDHRADLYALAIVLFECITGTLPFEGENELSLIQMQAHTPAPEVSDRAPWVPRPVSDVVKRALAKRPEERYVSAGELLTALQDAYSGKLPLPATARFGQPVGANSNEASKSGEFTQLSQRRSSARLGEPRSPPLKSLGAAPDPNGGPKTSELKHHARKSRVPLYLGALSVIGLLALSSAFVLSRATALSARASAHTDLLPNVVKPPPSTLELDAGNEETAAPAPIHQLDAGPSAVFAEPTAKPDTDHVGLADVDTSTTREESKPRPVRQRSSISHSISHLPGSLNVVTTLRGDAYWAWVLIDGVDRGKTPLNLELSPGKHRVHIEREGFRPADRQIKVASGRLVVLRIELRP